MIEAVKSYITNIIYCSFIIGVISVIPIQSKIVSGIIKFVSVMIVTIVIIEPITQCKFPKLTSFDQLYSSDIERIIEHAEDTASYEERKIINDLIVAYILDKASSLGVNINVTIDLSPEYPYTPEQIQISGPVSPYVRNILSEYIERNLGVAKEAQIWILQSGPKS